jgi:hypothetical protein
MTPIYGGLRRVVPIARVCTRIQILQTSEPSVTLRTAAPECAMEAVP